MKTKRKFFPDQHEGEACFRVRLDWIDGYREERRTARVTLRFSNVKDWDGDYGSMPYRDPRSDLAITCYLNANKGIYGFSHGYLDSHYIEAREADDMARTFKVIDRYMSKVRDVAGAYPATFGAYAMQVASAVQASRICIENDPEREARTGSHWHVVALSDAAYTLDGYLARVLKAERDAAGLTDTPEAS